MTAIEEYITDKLAGGGVNIKMSYFTSIGNPIVEIRRSYDRLVSTMGFPILWVDIFILSQLAIV